MKLHIRNAPIILSFICLILAPRIAGARPGAGGGDRARLQKILQLEDHRTAKAPLLVSSLRSSSPEVVKAALLALGRNADPQGLAEMGHILNGRDHELKKVAAFSLGLIGGDVALKFITQNLQMQSDAELQGVLLRALGRAGDGKSVPLFVDFLRDGGNRALATAACQGLGTLWNQDGSDRWEFPGGLLPQLAKLAAGDDATASACAFALSRFKGDVTGLPLPQLIAATQSKSPEVRALLFKALARAATNAQVTPVLITALSKDSDPTARVEAAKGLATAPLSPAASAVLRKALTDPLPRVVVPTLESIARHGTEASGLAPAVTAVYQNSPSRWARGTALAVLLQIQPIAGAQEAAAILNVPSAPLYGYAIAALGYSTSAQDVAKLGELVRSDDIKVVGRAVAALDELPESSFTPELKSALRSALSRADLGVASMTSQLAQKFVWKDFAPALATVYPLFTTLDAIEPKVSILDALAVLGDHSQLELLTSALKDPNREVVAAAVQAIKALGGKDESARIPVNSLVPASVVTPSRDEAMAATKAKVLLVTERGKITIALREEAPLTALNFLRLVRKKFYDGKTFHRIVPGFVAQGGDPRGDGYGGPGYFIREEWSLLSHERGRVGMATAGKDTAGSQFFIDLSTNPHLDGRYTVFGEVVEGMDVADRLEPEDKILTAREIIATPRPRKR